MVKLKEYFLIFICSECEKAKEKEISIGKEDVLKIKKELDKIKSKKEETKINFLLNSYGGHLYGAYKIMNMIRTKCNELIVIIPQFANSAASLMSLAGDYIVMGPQSELSPLDKPIEHPLLEGKGHFSALDGAKPFDSLFRAIREMAFLLAIEFRNEWELSREIALKMGFEIATNYVNATVKKMDPFILNMCNRWLQVTQRYATEFLNNYMFKDWDEKDKKKINDEILTKKEFVDELSYEMTYRYPEHSFAICRKEAHRIGLKIIPSEKLKIWETLWGLYLKFKEKDEKIIKLVDINKLKQE